MADRDPRMLPGITAVVANTIGGIAIVQFVGLLVLSIPAVLIAQAAHAPQSSAPIFLVILGCSLAVAVAFGGIFLPVSRAKQRRELEAGYTTILSEFNQFDGINWRTGQVVRTAVAQSVVVQAGDRFTTGEETGSVELGRSALRAALGLRGFVVGTFASLLVLVAGLWLFWNVASVHDWNPPGRDTGVLVLFFFVGFAGFCGVLITPIMYAVFYIPRYYRSRLAAHFPNARTFIGVPNNVDLVAELVGADSASLPHARPRLAGFVVIENDAIVLFSRYGSAALPYLQIPRSRIATSSLGSTSSWWTSGASYPDVALTVTKDNGTALDFQIELAITKGGARSPQIRNDCQWVVDWADPSARPIG
jgi:hypothetical protein